MWIPLYSKKRARSESEVDLLNEEPPAKRRAGLTNPLRESSPVREPVVPCVPRTGLPLPPEILDDIFEMNLPPENMFRAKPSLKSQKLNEPWRMSRTTKRAIVGVCKQWYPRGARLLYRNIMVTSLRTLRALRRTLEGKPHLGELVQGISFMVAVEIELWYEETAYLDMARILELCPNITRLAHLPPKIDRCYVSAHHFPAVPPTITSLNIGATLALARPEWVHATLQQNCAQLEELWLPAGEDDEAFDALPLSFPRLHTLYLTCEGFSTTFASQWHMPRLRALTFPASEYGAESLSRLFAEYTRILTRCGRTLTYLAFPPEYLLYDPAPADDLPDHAPLLAHCPALTHLVLPAINRVDEPLILPALRHLDIWCLCDNDAAVDAPFENEAQFAAQLRVCYPALVGLPRILDAALAQVLVDPPRGLSPDLDRVPLALEYAGGVLERRQISTGMAHYGVRGDPTGVDAGADDVWAALAQPSSTPEDVGDESSSDEEEVSSVDSTDGDDAAAGHGEGDGDRAPQPELRSALRRVLQATLPAGMFARLERAVTEFVVVQPA
ncbi:hypothetical protein B0H11DRAFT_1919122 [Mycena galericulata]|nr:hypothetical protein B0H11DRAFT_1919122 [Mycena galericulata]